MDLSVTLSAAIAVFVLMSSVWLISLAVRDASIVDIVWGINFVVIAWVVYLAGEGSGAMLLAALLVSAWGLRLSIHIGRRNIGHGEDRRYQAMRARQPETFWIASYPRVFLLQGALALIISVPLQSLGAQNPDSIGIVSFVGLAVFLVGLGFEGIGDAQLSAFKKDPSSKGQVMDRGLWKYTRHPNYFGDATVWSGLWLVAVGSGGAWWTVIGPVVMTFFLLNVSGVKLLESDMAKRRPGYTDYVKKTSAFFPLPPKS